jgi:hypothetical protein
LENLPAESKNVRTNANVCKINGKSAKNFARKSGKKHQQSKNPPNWFLKGSVVFFRSKREVTSYSDYNFLIEPEGNVAGRYRAEQHDADFVRQKPRHCTSIGSLFLSETTHVRRPELQTVRELNSRELIPVFKWE